MSLISHGGRDTLPSMLNPSNIFLYKQVYFLRKYDSRNVYLLNKVTSMDTSFEFVCDICGDIYLTSVPAGEVPTDHFPAGWVLVTTQGLDLPATDDRLACPVCRHPVIKSLGYGNVKNYETVVQAIAEIDDDAKEKTVDDLLDSQEAPLLFYSTDYSKDN